MNHSEYDHFAMNMNIFMNMVEVKLMLEKIADIESRSNSDRTPLSLAADGGHEAVVKCCLSWLLPWNLIWQNTAFMGC
jgi:ankyrin repeat protein